MKQWINHLINQPPTVKNKIGKKEIGAVKVVVVHFLSHFKMHALGN